MGMEDKINFDIFKVVTKAIAESNNLIVMANHLTQLLVGALEIKGCVLFALNPQSKELEPLASFGLSIKYMTKGTIFADKSIGSILSREPVVIDDVGDTDRLQYPEEAKQEGIGAIVSIPIMLYTESIGALRLYHNETWDISKQDLESLMILGENIGLAMTFTRVLNALSSVKNSIEEIHPIWIRTDRV
jgi:transcriptional regulator with GAF, ATPase, and Fis domain